MLNKFFRPSVPVKKGEQLTTTYTDTLKTTFERRRHLKKTKIFDCDCSRCEDPSENGTYGSSFLCEKCGGLVISMNSLDNKSHWICQKCETEYGLEVNNLTFDCRILF
jgi:formylmethanofuran dehydrogenase subunit E